MIARYAIPLLAVACLLPVVPAAAALVGGMAVALLFGNPHQAVTRKLTTPLLQLAVVGLGAGMDLRAVAAAGLHGIGWTAASIAVCMGAGLLLARALEVGRDAGLLITAGTAICGGSAIAALVPVLRPREHDASVALATVFLLNAVGLALFPPLGRALHLEQAQFGYWAALAIHDTSSVVGAGMAYGARALEIATTVKLARALWIVPLTFLVAAIVARREEGPSRRPSVRAAFIAGFVLAAALATFVPHLREPGQWVAAAARRLLVATLFLIGTGLGRSAIREVGARPLALGVLLWIVMGSLSLGGVLAGVLG